jgi:histone acetyltransferase (RNA polymerase elongator complex component)
MTNYKGSMHNQEQEPTIAVSTKLGTEAFDDKETRITLNKGYPNEVEAEKYATKIANNVVHKLKMTLGIENEETSTKQLMSFFQQKFRANNDGIYPPLVDDPRLEILNRNVFGPIETEEEK